MPKTIRQVTTLFAGAVFCGSLGMAQTPAKPDDSLKAAEPKVEKPKPAKVDYSLRQAISGGGVMVFIDPTTRKIRPAEQGEVNALTSSQSTAASAKAKPNAAKPSVASRTLRGPSGATGIRLDESSMQYMVVTRDSSGKLKEDCVTGAKDAQHAVTSAKVAPASSQPKGELDVQ